MKLAVIGSGYIGALNACCFAAMGHQVIGTDINEDRVRDLQQGHLPYYEEGLQELMNEGLASGRLRFTSDVAEAVRASEVIVLCVGQPPLSGDTPDLTPLRRSVKLVAEAIDDHRLIIERTTLPIESESWFIGMIHQHLKPGASFDVAILPQFVQEGRAVQDFFSPDRIVVGIYHRDQREQAVLAQIETLLGKKLFKNTPVLVTSLIEAELIKHATNALLAMKIAFINTISFVCDKTGADADVVAQGIALDRRVEASHLHPNLGYGGVFLPKDTAALVAIGNAYNIKLDLLKAVDVANRYHRMNFIALVESVLGRDLHGKTLGILGLAYQEKTNDLRECPSVAILKSLNNRGAAFRIHDPLAMPAGKRLIKNAQFFDDPYEAITDVDALLVLSPWSEFKTLDLAKLKSGTKGTPAHLIDGHGIFTPPAAREAGFTYHAIGR